MGFRRLLLRAQRYATPHQGRSATFFFAAGTATVALTTGAVIVVAEDFSFPIRNRPPSAKDDVPAPLPTSDLPIIALDEVQKHRSADSIWVTYNGVVYDVTSFATVHPGGKELLLTAGGLDLEHFFAAYRVHRQTTKANDFLEGMKIGRLSDADAQRAKREGTPHAHIESRMRVLGNARRRLVFALALMPLWTMLRFGLWILSFIAPPIANAIARHLPISVPGVGDAQILRGKNKRVAVIGGGIAGSGAAYALARSGYSVTIFEARKHLSGNAHTFDWQVGNKAMKTCVSVTAWPPHLYKNYVALLEQLNVKTCKQHLSWFLNSKVPGAEGFLWAADPSAPEGSLRKRFADDFKRYERAISLIDKVTTAATFHWAQEPSMYSLQTGLGPLNPFATFPLHHVCRLFGVSQKWWDVIFTPHYTASFLTDKLDNMVAVSGPLIESNIPLNPTSANQVNGVLTTCDTWANAGEGIREVFRKLTSNCTVHLESRVTNLHRDSTSGVITVSDDAGHVEDFDRVVFACQAQAIGNIHKSHNWIEDAILSVPEYADDHHPGDGHMHAVMHNDSSIIPAQYREEVLRKGSNYVEITQKADGSINIENTYNFGVQTPEANKLAMSEKPPMLITHTLGEGKTINPEKIVGTGNHARAHPLYSGWNVAALLALRLIQGRNGIYYCCNYTTPGNCHDMSLLSGLNVAYSIGAEYPFENNHEAKKDFYRLRSLMGL